MQEPTPSNTLAASGNAADITSSVATAPTATETPEKDAQQKSADSSSPIQALWADAQQNAHKEIWGVTLADPATHVPSQIILQKYLNANDGDLNKAKEQLKNTLNWRAKSNPSALIEKKYSKDKFTGLGFVTSYTDDTAGSSGQKEVFTWNIYGGVKDYEKSFGDLDGFIEWRVALMELAMRELDLSSAKTPITAEDDPYKIYQVHDYKGTSFFRSPPAVRSAAKKTIEVLAMAYPETLKEKFFINVPGKSKGPTHLENTLANRTQLSWGSSTVL